MIGYDEKRKTYFVQIKYKDSVTNKTAYKKKRGFKTKREAKIYEAELMQETKSTTSLITFREMNDRYCSSIQASDNEIKRRHACFEKRFPYYETPINKISKIQLEDWRSNLVQRTDIHSYTKNKTIAYVKSVFKYANNIYDINNVAAFLSLAKKTDKEIMEEERPVWTVEQFNKFLDNVELPLYKIFFETLFWTGMRRGECLALKKSDFDGDGFNINKSIREYKNGLKPTKTRQSRYILIDDTLKKDIEPLLKTDGEFLFGGETTLTITTVGRIFRKAKKDAGLDSTHVTIHCLRHSHATWLINNGVNIVAVSKRLGHSDINTTLRTYTHLLQNTDDKMMELINKNHQ